VKANDNEDSGKKKQSHAFTVINNVRDMCEQKDSNKKLLMLTLATYCDRDGMCWPGNRALALATRKSERTIRRMLRVLDKEGELEILTPGIGRDKKRIIQLQRYCNADSKPAKAVTGLNRTGSPIKGVSEQPPITTSTFSAKKKHILRMNTPNGLHTVSRSSKPRSGFLKKERNQ
jgi:Helix-turn-helix domain